MNEFQTILSDTANRLFTDNLTKDTRIAAEDGTWPQALWQAVEENGFCRILVSEARGGAGASWSDAMVLLKACGLHAVPLPLAETIVAAWFLDQAGLDVPEWMEGAPLPASAAEADDQARETVLTGWDSVHRNSGDRDKAEHTLALRTISTRTHVLTAYRPGSIYDGTEGELYDLEDDPLQRINRWDDPACAAIRKELMTALLDDWPQEPDERLPRVGPA